LHDSKNYSRLIVILLIAASCIAFGRIAGNDFINFDDISYITGNNYIQSGYNSESIKWAFTAIVDGNWHPLTMISHMLDWSLFGANASGHHLVSLLLHIGAVIFLFLFFNKTTNSIWPSAFTAALFAVHPLRVESVAWAAERKDVLSMFFGMACFYAYAIYVEKSKLSQYFLCLTLFALSLMSKPMLVTLPFLLILLDYWPLGRLWSRKIATSPADNIPVSQIKGKKKTKLKKESLKIKIFPALDRKLPETKIAGIIPLWQIWEKVPFFCLTIISCVITLWAQNKGGSIASTDIFPFSTRFSNVTISLTAYLVKIFWPVNLALFYPYEHSIPLWKVLISGIIIISITLAVLYYIRKLSFLFVGWFWYLGTLIPVIGLVQVGAQAMADRYTYLPSIGIAIGLAWSVPLLFPREDRRKKILLPAASAFLISIAVMTWYQCGYWKNSITIFSHALSVTKNNNMMHDNFGTTLFDQGRIQEAIDQYSESIRIAPNDFDAYFNRGSVYARLGQYQRALEDFNIAISLKPTKDVNLFYNNRGVAYLKLGQYQLAINDFNKSIDLKPDDADAYNNRASCYLIQGNREPGCHDAQKACSLGNCKTLEVAKGKGDCN
jgi:tetratricopeptide (TPR) repeat protein